MTESSELTQKQHLFVGQVFEGRFEILSVLGSGGVGVVYKAKHTHMDKVVAIKMLMTQVVSGDDSFKRFEQEARAASTLTHQNIITIHDFGKSVDGHAYLVMEYLNGVSLDDLLKTGGRLDLEQFLRIFTQLCDGLQHAHKKGIVHRDIKPSNVVLIDTEDAASVVKIVDFGLAKLMASDEDKQHLTKTGMVMGTPLYMSPEQCRGSELDHRSDIYSVGCVMYAALTGQVPLKGDSTFDTMYKHMQETPAPFDVSAPDLKLPPTLERAVFKALEKNAADRHQSMAELRQEITEAISAGNDRFDDRSKTVVSGANSAPSSGPSKAVPRSQTNVPSMGSALPPERRSSKRKPAIVAAAIGIVALAGAATAAFFAIHEQERQESISKMGLNNIIGSADVGNSQARSVQVLSAPSAPLIADSTLPKTDAFTPQASGGAASSDDVVDAKPKKESGSPAGGDGSMIALPPVQKPRLQSPQADADLAPTSNTAIGKDAQAQAEPVTIKPAQQIAAGAPAPQGVPLPAAAPVPPHSVILKVSRKAPAPLVSPRAPAPMKKEAPSNRAALLERILEREQKGNENFTHGQWTTAIPFYYQSLHYQDQLFGRSSPESFPVLARVVACSVNAQDQQSLKTNLDEAISIFDKNPQKVMAVVNQVDEPLAVWKPLARGSDSIAQHSQGEIQKSFYGRSADFFDLALRYRKGPKNSPESRELLNDLCGALNKAGDHRKALQVRRDFDLARLKELGQGAAQKRQETKVIIQEKMRESAQKRENFFRKGEERRLEQEQRHPKGHHY